MAELSAADRSPQSVGRVVIGPRWPYLIEGVAFLVFTGVVAAAAATRDEHLLAALLGVVGTVFALRVLAMRVRADGHGLRISNVLRSYRVAWNECDSFYEGYVTPGFNLGLGLPGRRVVLRTKSRGEIELGAAHAVSQVDFDPEDPSRLRSALWTRTLSEMLRSHG